MIKIFKKQTSSDKNPTKIKKLVKKRKRKIIKKQLVLKKSIQNVIKLGSKRKNRKRLR